MEMTDKNAVDLREAGLGVASNMKGFIQKHFKVVQSCDNGQNEPCFVTDYKNINGTTITYNGVVWSCGACATIASGASVCIDNVKCYSSSYGGYSTNYGNIFVDINGKKGPNILGRDAFMMAYFPDGVIDLPLVTPACRTLGVCNGGSIQTIRESGTNCETSTATEHQACFGKLLNNNWEMTY